MMEFRVYESGSTDPHVNLAIEEYLLESADNTVILYLWQNQNTVVIGKNQNPWKECKTTLLNEEGGHLARRLSGGGAVFHDLGNLNFTFLMPQDCFDLTRQFTVILEALRGLGVEASFTGRNDITAGGVKFSGNAFYKNGKAAYHHGTLLVDADMEKLSRYLSPSKAKLRAKGVDSVRSRVVNLKELSPEITIDSLKNALKESFARVYGPAQEIHIEDWDRIRALTERNRSWDWLYGRKLPFTFECEDRFPWGSVQVQLQVDGGMIREAKVYSDAMDWSFAGEAERALQGCPFSADALNARLRAGSIPHWDDLRRLLTEQDIFRN